MDTNGGWSDVLSIVALIISVATFILTRIDKWRDRKAVWNAKEPLINIVLERIPTREQWEMIITATNRGDYPFYLVSMSVPDDFAMNLGDGSTARRSWKINEL